MNTDRLTALAISDTGFVFDPVTGDSFNTSATGVDIINCLKSGKSVAEIQDTLYREYDVSERELEADITDFIRSLKTYYLIS